MVEECHLWAPAGYLLEFGVDVLVLEVLIDERSDFGEFVESSSAARLLKIEEKVNFIFKKTSGTIRYSNITRGF